METNNRAHAGLFLVRLSIRSTPDEWLWGCCDGDHRSPRSTCRDPAKTETTGIDFLRSPLLGWRSALSYVQPDTVVRWRRERFCKFWARWPTVNRRRRGRPATSAEIRRLIKPMVAANPLWRAPRSHGELTMLGIEISARTVSRILRTLRRPPSRTCKTFFHNHLGQLVSIDFFTVPTITMKVLFVFSVLEHRRREVLHLNVTEHPTAAWASQQIVEAFADRDAPRYLIRDRDGVYGNEVRLRIASLHTKEVLTAPQKPGRIRTSNA